MKLSTNKLELKCQDGKKAYVAIALWDSKVQKLSKGQNFSPVGYHIPHNCLNYQDMNVFLSVHWMGQTFQNSHDFC